MHKFSSLAGVLLAAALAASCGESSPTASTSGTTSPGTLAVNPPLRIASLNAVTLAGELGGTTVGAQLLQAAGAPACGVDFYYLEFWTLGAANETTQSSGALMVPTGGSGCSGPRPIVLYAHGTQASKSFNIADITNPANSEGPLVAAVFAAQGYIVVAPNYAGYDISTLGYHPFLNAAQQSGEMMNILTAARTALPSTLSAATSDNGQLFITGYSEGGHVAMATLRAMQAAGAAVTAAAPLSGPYALEAFGDTIFSGSVDLGATEFTPLLTTSYQKAYGNIYSATTDLYSPTYATGIETLLPSSTPIATLESEGLLPEFAEFDSTTPTVNIAGAPALSLALTGLLAVPSANGTSSADVGLFDLGFGSPYLIINDYRVSYIEDAASNPDGALPAPNANGSLSPPKAGAPLAAVAPTQPLRLAFYKNDLRNGGWLPKSPTLLCGGNLDPTVFWSVNTETMNTFWSGTAAASLITVLDVNGTPSGSFATIQTAFADSQAALLAYYQTPAGGGLSLADATLKVEGSYHVNVAPFCAIAARSFFKNFLGE